MDNTNCLGRTENWLYLQPGHFLSPLNLVLKPLHNYQSTESAQKREETRFLRSKNYQLKYSKIYITSIYMSVWTCMLTHRKAIPMLPEFSRAVAYTHTIYHKLCLQHLSPANVLYPCIWPVFPSQGKIAWTHSLRGEGEGRGSWQHKRDGEKIQNTHVDGTPWRSPPPRKPSHSTHSGLWSEAPLAEMWVWGALMDACLAKYIFWSSAALGEGVYSVPVTGQGFGRHTPKGGPQCCTNLKIYPNNIRTHLGGFMAHLDVTLY